MKKFFLFLILTASALASWAYDFSAVAPSGQTLYFNIIGSTATVTPPYHYPSYSWVGSTNRPTGALTIPSSVTNPNSGLTYSVTSIDHRAFVGCSDLTSITIPYTVTSISDRAFFGCSSLTSVTIPNSVTSIEDNLFEGCSSLTSVTIPNSVTSIGNCAFEGCSSLTSVTIGNSVTSIGRDAFLFCSSLTSVTIPNSVTTIGGYAFANCSGLTSVTIPNSVTTIGGYAFSDCSLTSVDIPNSVTSMGEGIFAGCSDLTSVTIPDSVTSIGDYAFLFCSSLTSITIPNSVSSIGDYAFSDCSNLTTVIIGASVANIGCMAFAYCDSLTSIISHAIIAPNCCDNAFYSSRYNFINIYIPCGSTASYQASWYGNNFLESPIHTIIVTSSDTTQGHASVTTQPTCTTPTAVITASPTANHYFHHWNDGSTTNPRSVNLTQDTTFIAYFTTEPPHHDTIIIHDTLYIERYIHDTIFQNIDYRTLSVISRNLSYGLAAGNGNFPLGSQVEIAAIPIRGSQFVSWQDGNTDNPRSVTLDNDLVFVATFDELEGIADLQPTDYTISTQDNQVIITGATNQRVRIFDSMGRLLSTAHGHNDKAVFQAPAMGVYLVQVGDNPAQKVVLR